MLLKIIKLPFLNSKNIAEKNLAKDIISNIKLLFFIPTKYIEDFYSDIKKIIIQKVLISSLDI